VSEKTDHGTDYYRACLSRFEQTFGLLALLQVADDVDEVNKGLLERLPEMIDSPRMHLFTFDEASGAIESVSAPESDARLADFHKSLARRVCLDNAQFELHADGGDSAVIPSDVALPGLLFAYPLGAEEHGVTGAILLQYGGTPKEAEIDRLVMGKVIEVLPEIYANAERKKESKVALEQLQTLLEVGTLISSELELKSLLTLIASKTSQLLNAERSSVYVVDRDTDEIYTVVGEGLGATVIRMPTGTGLAGYCAKTGEIVNEEDVYRNPNFNPDWDKKTGWRTKSMLVYPMKDKQGETIGVFQVMNKEEGAFTQDDMYLLHALSSSASVAVENAILYEEQKKQFSSFIETLATTVDAKDPTTGNHSLLVTGIAVAIAKEMKLPPEEVEKIRIAAVVHDFGKIAVPDRILCKPGELGPDEMSIMRSHAAHTIRILKKIYFSRRLRDVPELAGMHHERLDGTGYPLGLKNGEISLDGRILAIADIFQAMMQERPYKRGLTPRQALDECEKLTRPHAGRFGGEEGIHLDADVVAVLRRLLERNNFDTTVFEKESGWHVEPRGA
jgi:HD-GYP domain-containing protein (c-di-GMP phosphodiesterase class II)